MLWYKPDLILHRQTERNDTMKMQRTNEDIIKMTAVIILATAFAVHVIDGGWEGFLRHMWSYAIHFTAFQAAFTYFLNKSNRNSGEVDSRDLFVRIGTWGGIVTALFVLACIVVPFSEGLNIKENLIVTMITYLPAATILGIAAYINRYFCSTRGAESENALDETREAVYHFYCE